MGNIELPIGTLVPAILFSIARFENQRWMRARNRGLRGASEGFGQFVDITGGLAFLFTIVFIAAFAYDAGMVSTVALLAITFIVGVIFAMIVRDNIIAWIVSTFALWPLALWLAFRVTWFGIT